MFSEYAPDIPFEDMIDYVTIDKKNGKISKLNMISKYFWIFKGCSIGDCISIKKKAEDLLIFVNDIEVACIPDKIDINYVEDVNWDDILKKKYNVNDVIKRC